jgi:hypothetical protein
MTTKEERKAQARMAMAWRKKLRTDLRKGFGVEEYPLYQGAMGIGPWRWQQFRKPGSGRRVPPEPGSEIESMCVPRAIRWVIDRGDSYRPVLGLTGGTLVHFPKGQADKLKS